MRTIVIDQATDLQSLSQRLAGSGAKGQPLADSIRRLNPHVNFDRLGAGTVLLVADDAGLDAGLTRAPGAQQAESLAAQLKAGVESAIAGALDGLATRAGERKAVAAALRTPAMKRAIEADIDLKARASSVADDLKKEQAQAKDTEQALKQMLSSAQAEIGALLKTMG